jgi:hypothetical protein
MMHGTMNLGFYKTMYGSSLQKFFQASLNFMKIFLVTHTVLN